MQGTDPLGDELTSPALVADGNHARVDAFVSLGVVASALVVDVIRLRRARRASRPARTTFAPPPRTARG